MLKEHSSFVKQSIAFLDCLLITAVFYLSYYYVSDVKEISPASEYRMMLAGYIAFYLYFSWNRHLFSILQFNWMKGLYKRILAVFISAGILGASILYLLPDSYNSRTLYLFFNLGAFAVILAEKYAMKFAITSARKHNRNTTPIILFGRGRTVSGINKEITLHPEWGYRVVKKLDISIKPSEFEDALRSSYVEEVFFCFPRSITNEGFSIDPFLQICEEMGRPARVFVNLATSTYFAKWEYNPFLGFPTFISHTVELDPDQIVFKRIFDIIGGLVGIILLAIMYPFLAIAIKLSSPGPVFFRQVRVGKNGKRFVIYKFRSMSNDAEEKKKELQDQNELEGAVFKMKNDPRITPIGKIIRKLSLDEFPQFINVLKGEMSLVGTRPPTPEEVSEYENWHHRRISNKPGVTGLWQVSGRNSIKDFDEIVKLDLKYIDSWNIWLDIAIIFKTFTAIFNKDDAY